MGLSLYHQSHEKINVMQNLKSIFNLRHNVDVFQSMEAAVRCAERCIKLHVVMLGDNNKFWVVCFADAQRLFKNGYEIAK